MRLVRFQAGEGPAWGILRSGEIDELARGFADIAAVLRTVKRSEAQLLAPVAPTKIVAVGLNYRDHATELGMSVPENPILFLKPPTSVIGPGESIVRPAMSRQVDFEAELGIVIRDRVTGISPAEARKHVLGYTCANDVTARDLQKKDGQWTRAKSFDTFCPVGPWIETDLDPDDLLVESYLNGARKQSSRTSQFIFGIDHLVSFISQVMTLEPGDLIITGTPAGIGPMQPGDDVEVRVEGIGSLKNIVQNA
ncbi:MAG: fumarylacetoacetate hydrolase family protein [Nitrospiraceae bacterium]|nr:fumarylacetoacetate hydrolase family protein [Nitrospiraceae bacterium]